MKKKRVQTGVYRIRNTVNGKVYVGSSSQDLLYRWQIHRSELRAGRHDNVYLQRSWLKHGEAKFAFEVIEYCSPKQCVTREQYWIDRLQSANPDFGYNRNPTAGSMLGFRHSDESKRKISRAGKGRRHTEDTKRRIAAKLAVLMKGNQHFAGKKHSVESRRKIGEAAKAFWKDPKNRERMLKKMQSQRQTSRDKQLSPLESETGQLGLFDEDLR